MSRIYQALQQSVAAAGRSEAPAPALGDVLPETATVVPELPAAGSPASELDEVPVFSLRPRLESRLVAVTEESGMAAERLRMLITRLRHIQRRRAFRKILITSTVRGEGKSMMSANLALALARQNNKTLLIDGDLRQPSLGKLFDIHGESGLSDWWRGQGSIARFLKRAEGSPLWFLPAGRIPEQPGELLQSARTAQLLAQLGQLFDWVIIDSPPVGPIADAGNWITLADAMLLVVRCGLTPKKLLERSLDGLDRSKIIGIVMNEAECSDQKYYRGYYGETRQPGNAAQR